MTIIPCLTHWYYTIYTTHTLFLYRSLLDEPQFQQCLLEGDIEQVPYFTQLRPAPVRPTKTQPHFSAESQDPVQMSSVSSAALAETYPENCNTGDRPKTEYEQEALTELQEEIKMKVQESIRRFENSQSVQTVSAVQIDIR